MDTLDSRSFLRRHSFPVGTATATVLAVALVVPVSDMAQSAQPSTNPDVSMSVSMPQRVVQGTPTEVRLVFENRGAPTNVTVDLGSNYTGSAPDYGNCSAPNPALVQCHEDPGDFVLLNSIAPTDGCRTSGDGITRSYAPTLRCAIGRGETVRTLRVVPGEAGGWKFDGVTYGNGRDGWVNAAANFSETIRPAASGAAPLGG
jgi:hypothetical protein